MNLKLNYVRAAFVNTHVPRSVTGEDQPAYSLTSILHPDHEGITQCREVIDSVGKEKWGGKWPTIKKELEAKDRLPLHSGDTKADYAGFAGNYFISARSKTRPLVIDRDKTPLVAEDGKPYSGCYVNVSLDIWAMDNQYGRRICASLRGVQFAADGDPFSGSQSASAEDFEVVSEESLV
jgi:hypothetical protein